MSDKLNKNRNLMLGIGIILSFTLLLISISTYYSYQHDYKNSLRIEPSELNNMSIDEIKNLIVERRSEETVFHGYYIIPFIGFVGLIVGTLVYYIMSDKLLSQESSLKRNTKIILNFLSPHERKVIETLLENEGRVRQYELSHLDGLNKVKTHRILNNLEQKGIIHKERLGKVNKIVLNKDLYEVLRDNN